MTVTGWPGAMRPDNDGPSVAQRNREISLALDVLEQAQARVDREREAAGHNFWIGLAAGFAVAVIVSTVIALGSM